MAASHFSPNWYRVKDLRPRLRATVRLVRHVVRGNVWHVVSDQLSGNHFRVGGAAYRFLCGLDGRQKVGDLWEEVLRHGNPGQFTQDDAIRFLAQLHRSDMITTPDLPDMGEMMSRARRNSRSNLANRFRNPLSIRIPLVNPDAFLSALLPSTRWMFGPAGFALWLAAVLAAVVLAAVQWASLTHNIVDRVISLSTVAAVLVIYPVMKVLHEIGHGLAVKAWGGRVHEMGLMLLLFVPVPYVDASEATRFPERRRRAIVGGMGVMVELGLASVAMLVWTLAEPGLVRAAAFNVMLIGGVSTLLFNGNPLLRFDGYYVLSDLTDIPNLATRSSRYLQYLILHHVFGQDDVQDPSVDAAERIWFVAYGILSFLYRTAIMLVMSLLVATRFFFVGVILAALSVSVTMGLPLAKAIHVVFFSRRLGKNRTRARLLTGSAILIAAAFLLLVPMPDRVTAPAIVWIQPDAHVVASNVGFVASVGAAAGEAVKAGQTLFVLADPDLDTRIALLLAEEREYQARLEALAASDKAQAKIVAEQLSGVRATLAVWQQRKSEQVVVAGKPGIFHPVSADSLLGQQVGEGRLLGYILSDGPRILHAVVPEDRINAILLDDPPIAIRFPSAPGEPFTGTIVQVTPAAIDHVPSPVLTPEGGGDVLLDPRADPRDGRPLLNSYEVEIQVQESAGTWRANEPALVRFDLRPKPLALQAWRSLRGVFLRHFNV